MASLDLRERLLERCDLSAQFTASLAGLRGVTGGWLPRHVQRGRHLARVDTRPARLARGVGGDLSDGRGLLSDARDERAGALTAVDQALLLEALVDGSRRVRVDPDHLGELAQARQSPPGGQAAVADPRSQRPGELHPDRDLSLAIDRQVFEVELGPGGLARARGL